MAFLIAKKNRAVVVAAAMGTERTVAFADTNPVLCGAKGSVKHLRAGTWGRTYND